MPNDITANQMESFEEAQDKEAKKLDELVSGLSAGDEELLKEAFDSQYTGTDDDMLVVYERWLETLTRQEIIDIIF